MMINFFSYSILFICALLSKAFAVTYTIYTENLPPYVYQDNNILRGFAVDTVSELFKSVDVNYEIKLLPLRRAYLTVKSTPNTCVFPFERNQQRESSFEWVGPLFISHIALYTNSEFVGDINNLVDIKNMTVGTYIGSGTEEYLIQHGFNVSAVPRDELNLFMLVNDRINVWATDNRFASYILDSKEMQDEIKKHITYFTVLRSIACHSDTSVYMVNKLNQKLILMHQSGRIRQIEAEYHRLNLKH